MTFPRIAATEGVPIVFLLGCFLAIAVKKLRVALELMHFSSSKIKSLAHFMLEIFGEQFANSHQVTTVMK